MCIDDWNIDHRRWSKKMLSLRGPTFKKKKIVTSLLALIIKKHKKFLIKRLSIFLISFCHTVPGLGGVGSGSGIWNGIMLTNLPFFFLPGSASTMVEGPSKLVWFGGKITCASLIRFKRWVSVVLELEWNTTTGFSLTFELCFDLAAAITSCQ